MIGALGGDNCAIVFVAVYPSMIERETAETALTALIQDLKYGRQVFVRTTDCFFIPEEQCKLTFPEHPLRLTFPVVKFKQTFRREHFNLSEGTV